MFGLNKKWKDRNIAPKKCKECGNVFNPTCGGNMYCKECSLIVKRRNHANGMREWRRKNPDRSMRVKVEWDLRKYGISLEEHNELLCKQGNMCAICGTLVPGGRGVYRKFAVDHCHKTGKIRGLLCFRCNTGIGLFLHDTKVLKRAIIYLEKNNE